ncbi:MAG TPA: hypothetical protein VGQ59_10420 [Cyclobacteriaceae bacterium]|jgi:hypothetical protein|nr:hypothetical protein [Cyclobacteriaceae bacterium]
MGLDLWLYHVEPTRNGKHLATTDQDGLYLFESSTSNRRFISEIEMDYQNGSTDIVENMPFYYRPINMDAAIAWAKKNFPNEERAINTLLKMKENPCLWLQEDQ